MARMRTIHRRITAKLEQIASPSIVVGCGRCVSLAELAAGELAHLGITYAGGQLTLPTRPIIPPASTGPISTENVNGREVTHTDQAKISKDIYLGDRPNYGDWSKGSFPLWQTRKVYPSSFIPPRGVSISVSDQGLLESGGCWRLAFTLEPPLVRVEAAFDGDLLFFLSLAKEAIGCFDVYSSNASPDEIIETRSLQWEIFPTGQRGFREALERRLSRSDQATRGRLLARADVINALNPVRWAIGSGFNSNYYGAILADDLVIFENLDYGNATYVLREDWERLSQLSRTELLGSSTDFDRLIHDANWQDRITQLIARERQRRRRRR